MQKSDFAICEIFFFYRLILILCVLYSVKEQQSISIAKAGIVCRSV